MKKVLSIAGSDCSGGAGIQADLKTIMAHHMYGMSVITALTAQNTMGVTQVLEVPPQFVSSQLDAVFTDLYPDAVKIGMVSTASVINQVAERLRFYGAGNIILDPVMISTSGKRLLDEDAMEGLIQVLMPLAMMVTPNIPEAQVFGECRIHTREDMRNAAKRISKRYSGAILIKGGHLTDSSDDLLYYQGEFLWFDQKHIDNPNTHGTGCTLSSAIACHLAAGYSIAESIRLSKEYITGAIAANLNLGKGNGPLHHGWNLSSMSRE